MKFNSRHLGAVIRVAALALGLLAFAQSANAACASPAGNTGDIRYASNYGVMAYCSGAGNWTSMAGGVSVTVNTSGGGATPAGSTNDIQFNNGGSLGADTGNFTYATSGGLLTVTNISATALSVSGQGTFGSLLVNGGMTATGVSSLTTVSASTISSTLMQLSANTTTACTAGLAGGQRYNDTNAVIEFCNGTSWTTVGPSFGASLTAFTVYNNTTQTIANNGTAAWNVALLNNGGAFSTSTGRFTAPATGLYFFIGTFLSNTDKTNVDFRLFKNGVDTGFRSYNGITASTNTAAYAPSTLQGVLSLVAGDKVDVRNVSGAAGSLETTVSRFSGFIINAGTGSTGGSGVSAMSSLTDVALTNLSDRDYLRYSNSLGKWVNISESTVMSTTTMVSGWPDALVCHVVISGNARTIVSLLADAPSVGGTYSYYPTWETTTGSYGHSYTSAGAFNTLGSGITSTDCNKSISQLYASGQAFNFIGSANTSNSTALGDRITSGTLAMTANSATAYISLTTSNTTWGYLNSAQSFLPQLTTNQVSASTISTTLLQIAGNTTTACTSGLAGSQRYNSVSNTIDYCTGTAWMSMGPSSTQPISFRVDQASAQSVSDGTFTKITNLTNKYFDTNNNFASSRFTVTVPGKYLLTAQTAFDFSGAGAFFDTWLVIYKNGSTYATGARLDMASSSGSLYPTMSAIVDAQAGDYFEVYIYQHNANSASQSTIYARTGFAGVLLAPQGGGAGGGTATPAGSTGDIQFNTANALDADTGNLFWDQTNHRLGIGTNSPSDMVVISATTATSNNLLSLRNGFSTGYAQVAYYGDKRTYSAGVGNSGAPQGLANKFYVYDSVSGSARIVVDLNGNVGIANVTPTAALDVGGEVRVGNSGLSCGSTVSGAMRYTSGTMQVCDGSNWTNVGIGIPQGTISAFAATSCPSGWSEYTAARGRFLRGIDNGAGIDPSGTRAPGNQQGDALRSHSHSLNASILIGQQASSGLNAGVSGGSGYSKVGTLLDTGVSQLTGSTGATETRPANVAVIFCQYQGYQSQLQTGVATLASLSDVSVAGATNGQVLAYNGSSWVPSDTTAGSAAQGDRITSSTFAIIANPTAYVSLSTNGTTWGYFGNAASYLPQLQVGNFNAGNVSTTLLQTGASSATCGATLYGTLRWNATSDTIQICNTAGWTSLSSSTVPNTIVSNGTANYGAIFSGPNTLVTDSALYIDRSNHRIGVQTTSPQYMLEARSYSSTVNAGIGTTNDNSVSTLLYTARSGLGINDATVLQNVGNKPIVFTTTAGVGVGNNTPIAKLDIAGTVSASDAIQVGSSSLMCGSGIAGAIRYNGVSNTIDYCSGSAWLSLGPSSTQPISFSVNKGGTNQTVTASTWTKISFNTVTFDTNSNFSAASSRFTPTVPGKYAVNAGVYCSNSTNWCIVSIYKNGATYSNGRNQVSATGTGANVSTIVDMNGTSDYLEAWVYSGGTTIDGTATNTFFNGVLLSPQGSGSAGVTNPAGFTGDIQYNNGGAFAADTANLFWDGTNHRLGVGTGSPAQRLEVASSGANYSTARVSNGTSSLDVAMAPTGLAQITQNGAYGLAFSTNATERMRIDETGRVGINITPQSNVQFYTISDTTNLTGTNYSGYFGYTQRASSSGAYVGIGLGTGASPIISSGVSNTSGNTQALNVSALRNAAGDAGGINGLYGALISYGHNNGTSTARQTSTSVGMQITPYAQNGTQGTMFDLLLTNLSTGGTVGTHYAIYQQDNTAANVFGGGSYFGNDIFLNNATNNVIWYGTTGVAAPGAGSNGQKIQLYGTAGTVGSGDYALGIQNSNMWFNSGGGYYWYSASASKMILDASGNLTATAFLYSSDKRLKSNITGLTGGLAKLDALNPVSFRFTADPSKTVHLGLIAQDVQKVYPEAVKTNDKGFLALDYPALIGPIVDILKELKTLTMGDHDEIARLKAANDNLAKDVSSLKVESEKLRSENALLKASNDNVIHRLDAIEKRVSVSR